MTPLTPFQLVPWVKPAYACNTTPPTYPHPTHIHMHTRSHTHTRTHTHAHTHTYARMHRHAPEGVEALWQVVQSEGEVPEVKQRVGPVEVELHGS
jgi:hypothetical protein